jgi:aromatic ring-opening dioxygenase LigB subunit
VSLVFACIAPHGDMDLDPSLRAAMEELGRRFAAAAPDVAVVVSPHSVHVEGHFAVVTAAKVGEWETDAELAAALLETPLPILGVSYGANDPGTAEFPLDWGTEVPLEFLRPPRVVVVAPARDRPLEEHLRLGQVIASNTVLQGKRVALVASADNGHAHDPDGPYGFDSAAAEYDAQLQEILASDRLDFLSLAELVEPAKADSLWQLLVLQGAVGESARADVLAYGAPTYYGMLVAEIQTAA